MPTKRMKQTNFLAPKALLQAVKATAKQEERTMGDVIRRAIEAYVTRQDAKASR